jgi:hypothetical protein
MFFLKKNIDPQKHRFQDYFMVLHDLDDLVVPRAHDFGNPIKLLRPPNKSMVNHESSIKYGKIY